jgi:hypothetical protein
MEKLQKYGAKTKKTMAVVSTKVANMNIEKLKKSKQNLFDLWKSETKKNTKRARLFAAAFDEVSKLIKENEVSKNDA